MKKFNVLFRWLLLLVYFNASLLTATHIHDDALEHDDCSVCIMVKTLDLGDAPKSELLTFDCCRDTSVIYHHAEACIFSLGKGFNANAPPCFS